MPRTSSIGLHFLLIVVALCAGPVGCDFDLDLSGLDLGSGNGCYLCYPEPLGTPPFDSVPVAVSGGLTFTTVSVGTRHVCALGATGAYCWGERDPGAPAFRVIQSPLAVAGSAALRHITAGESITCGLEDTGLASCWGINGSGELGTGVVGPPSALPAAVAGGLAFTAISTSGTSTGGVPHTCGLTAGGAAHCWGGNEYGQLGVGSVGLLSASPVAVSGGHDFESISVGAKFVCGIVRREGVRCWGKGSDGQLGDDPRAAGDCAVGGGQLACTTVPVRVANSQRFRTISTGAAHACTLDADGAAFCWGANLGGQLGTGDMFWRFAPVAVSTALRFTMIAAGTSTTCALAVGGAAYCWGGNWLGQVGDGTTVPRPVPTRVASDLSFTIISMGYHTACALTDAGTAHCWGSNESGKLGTGA